MATDVPWQPHEDERLRAGWQTESLGVIANALGRTRSAVVGRAYRIGLPRKPPPSVLLERPAPRKQPAEPPPAVAEASASAPPAPKRLLELALWDCHWPLGDPRDPDFAFCAAPALRPFGYCPHHQRLNFTSR